MAAIICREYCHDSLNSTHEISIGHLHSIVAQDHNDACCQATGAMFLPMML